MSKMIHAPVQLTVTEALNFRAVPVWVHQIAKVLRDAGHQAYLVGGAVRDLIWGLVPDDWDLATDARPEEMEGLFPETIVPGKLGRARSRGREFGTVIIRDGGYQVEVTTLRADLGYEDGRHPAAVSFGHDIAQDLARRDFTINAMAYDLTEAKLIDPFQGRRDCYRRVLKTVGDPGIRFSEDGLRVLRFYRFLATHDLRPDHRTERAVTPSFVSHLSMERVRDEFSKLLLGKRVVIGLEGLARHGLIELFLPELLPALGFELGRRRLWRHLLSATATIAPVLELRLAALLHDIAKPRTCSVTAAGVHFYGHDEEGAHLSEIILQRLRYPKKVVDKVCALVRWHMFNLPPEAGQAALRRFSAKVGVANLPALLELRRADIVATDRVEYIAWQQWSALQERFQDMLNKPELTRQLAVNGHDLNRELKISPGPIMGKILKHLNELILEHPEFNQKERLLQAAEEFLRLKE